MQFFSETIELSRVDSADTTYQISTQKPVEDLMASILQVGLLSPPILQSLDAGRLIIISGFRRVSACLKLGLARLDARIVSSDASALKCCQLAIADNTTNRTLNTIEQAIAVSRLSLFFDDDRLLSREAQKLGLHVNPDLVKKLKILSTLYPELFAPVISGVLSLTIALELGNLDRDSALIFLHLFETLKPTLSHQKEILTMAREISLAAQTPIFQLIRGIMGTDLSTGQNNDRHQKIREIRGQLQRLRYPEMVRFEENFQERVQRLDLPGFIRLVPPINFEGTDFNLTFTFQNINQFKSGVEFITHLATSHDFKKILDKDVEDIPSIH